MVASNVDRSAAETTVPLRCLLRYAALRRQDGAALDIKTVFLRAPLIQTGTEIIVKTPAIFRMAGCGSEFFWAVDRALYGLIISPKSWSTFRDKSLEQDFNVIINGEGRVAILAVYVDDLLCFGQTSVVTTVLDLWQRFGRCRLPSS